MSQNSNTKQHDHDNEKISCRCSEKTTVESPLRHTSRLKMSPVNFRTPVQVNRLQEIREEEVENEIVDSKSQTASFILLPSHSTPPQQEKTVQNPFDAALIRRLHLPVVSPSIFKRVVSPSQETCNFSWTIDDVAKLRPAPIEESIPEQHEHIDPELELKAQEAINRYFRNTPMVVPSPWGPSTVCMKSKSENSQSLEEIENEEEKLNKEAIVDAKSPVSSERVSKHTSLLVTDSDDSAEEANLSSSTLRRKLFSQEQEETDDVFPLRLSCLPVQLEYIKMSPLRSGVLFNSSKIICPSTPISKEQRFGTPITKCKQLIDSPEVSPIRSSVFSGQSLLRDKTRRKLCSPCSSPLGASPLKCYEGSVSMVQQWESEDRSMASLHTSYSAMITSEASTPTKQSSVDRLMSVGEIDFQYISEKAENISENNVEDMCRTNHHTEYQRIHVNNSTNSAFSSTPIKKVPQGELFSMEHIDLSHFRNPTKKENGDQSDEEDMLSLNSQDTGYQTGLINSGATSSGFSSLNNWSSMQQSQAPLINENCEKLLYSVSKTATAVEENSLWKPSCKYIISSTPTKASSL